MRNLGFGVAVAALFAGTPAAAGEIGFAPVAVPQSDADKRAVIASNEAVVDGRKVSIGYHTLLRSGDRLGDGVFGQLLDRDGKPIPGKDGAPVVANSADFSSLLPVGDRLYSISHVEARPGAMYLSELKQDKATGELTAVSTRSIDVSPLGGLWVPCAGSVTPWSTHLGSEEYPPDAYELAKAKSMDDLEAENRPMARYFGLPAEGGDIDALRAVFNPYRYGFPVEVRVAADGSATPTKHYAMGRVSLELAHVMPDERTVYLSDDGSNVGFYLFVADRPGGLTAGRLYAAKWHQTSAEGGGAADITWIDLGHADEATIGAAIDKRLGFADLFDSARPDEEGRCPAGFASVNLEPRCLKVKPGMEIVASRLETTRYAAYRGATTELRKEEGITFDPDEKTLFVAMSEISSGMEDRASKGKSEDKYDAGGPNDIRVDYNPCGAVYRLEMGRDDAIGSDFVVRSSRVLVAGKPMKYGDDSPFKGNTCDLDGIANPDNLSFISGYRTLIIGEDSGTGHQNDAVWSYNLDGGKLTRIETTPYGAETTSVYAYRNINSWGYLMSVVQHPYGESDRDKLADPADARAYVGYIGPFPALTK
jgi:secreted PhoX family phosphatase